MHPQVSLPLLKRQTTTSEEPSNNYFSTTGYAVRYGITIAVVAIILIFFLGGYYHARYRTRNGKPLLWYHRWMIRNNRPGAYNPYYVRPGFGAPGRYPPAPGAPPAQYYEMNGWQQPPPGAPWAPPPPAYGQHSTDVPPAYLPPPGGSKVAPVQGAREGEGSSAQGGLAQMEVQGVQRPGEVHSDGVIR